MISTLEHIKSVCQIWKTHPWMENKKHNYELPDLLVRCNSRLIVSNVCNRLEINYFSFRSYIYELSIERNPFIAKNQTLYNIRVYILHHQLLFKQNPVVMTFLLKNTYYFYETKPIFTKVLFGHGKDKCLQFKVKCCLLWTSDTVKFLWLIISISD